MLDGADLTDLDATAAGGPGAGGTGGGVSLGAASFDNGGHEANVSASMRDLASADSSPVTATTPVSGYNQQQDSNTSDINDEFNPVSPSNTDNNSDNTEPSNNNTDNNNTGNDTAPNTPDNGNENVNPAPVSPTQPTQPLEPSDPVSPAIPPQPVAPEITHIYDDVGSKRGYVEGKTTDDNRPTIQGNAEPNSIVAIYDNDKEIGTTKADENGKFEFTPDEDLPDGEHIFKAVSNGLDSNEANVNIKAPLNPDNEILPEPDAGEVLIKIPYSAYGYNDKGIWRDPYGNENRLSADELKGKIDGSLKNAIGDKKIDTDHSITLVDQDGKEEQVQRAFIKMTTDEFNAKFDTQGGWYISKDKSLIIGSNKTTALVITDEDGAKEFEGKSDVTVLTGVPKNSIVFGGDYHDDILIKGVEVTQVRGGDGADAINAQDAKLGYITGGMGGDSVSVKNSNIVERYGKRSGINLDDGDDELHISDGSNVRVIYGGKGDDDMDAKDSHIRTIQGDEGDDTIGIHNTRVDRIDERDGKAVVGTAGVNTGVYGDGYTNGGEQNLSGNDTIIIDGGSNIKHLVHTGGGTDNVKVSGEGTVIDGGIDGSDKIGGSIENLEILDHATVKGNIHTGNDDNTVIIKDSTVNGVVSLEGGDDKANIENSTISNVIRGDNGNDTIQVSGENSYVKEIQGNGDYDSVIVSGNAHIGKVDGLKGTDSLLNIDESSVDNTKNVEKIMNAHLDGKSLVIDSFETFSDNSVPLNALGDLMGISSVDLSAADVSVNLQIDANILHKDDTLSILGDSNDSVSKANDTQSWSEKPSSSSDTHTYQENSTGVMLEISNDIDNHLV